MYFVKYGNEYLHDSRAEDCMLLDLSLTAQENSCGYCDFTIHSNHPMYNKLKERDNENLIKVYDDDVLLFSGFIYELSVEFYLECHVKCKGELDYLNDSIIRPYSTLQRGFGQKAPTAVGDYFRWLIEQHNSQVESNKRFEIGINQGFRIDANNYIYRSNDRYPTTIEEISNKLLNNPNAGGYLHVRHENGVRYIDYLTEWTDTNSQLLEFGTNLTDYTQTDDAASIATFVVPLGAPMNETPYPYKDGYFITHDTVMNPSKDYYTLSEDGVYMLCDNLTEFDAGTTYYEYNPDNDESELNLTINGVSYIDSDLIIDGDLIYSISGVRKYGRIGFVYENTDITLKENLAVRGMKALKNRISPTRTIEIKAVDMHLVNPDIKPIRIGEYIRVKSGPHNLDSYFLCTSIDLDLNNPQNSLYTLGTTFDVLTGQSNKKINELNETISKSYIKQ